MNVNELQGWRLDAAVAQAEGMTVTIVDGVVLGDRGTAEDYAYRYTPSTDWAQGGPIIERERIMLVRFDDRKEWTAWVGGSIDVGGAFGETKGNADGPTPLIAAMRAYVASKHRA